MRFESEHKHAKFNRECDDCLDARYVAVDDAVQDALTDFFIALSEIAELWDIDSGYLSDMIRKTDLSQELREHVNRYGWPV